jgi:hypothetical protein
LLDRYRKSVKSKRNQEEFEATKAEIEELLALKCDEEIELWFYDESGFDLTFSVPSARQTIGIIILLIRKQSTFKRLRFFKS